MVTSQGEPGVGEHAAQPSMLARRPRLDTGLAESMLMPATAVAVFLAARSQGSFGVASWGPLGLVLLGAVMLLALGDRRAPRSVTLAAATLVLIGVWSLASTQWGGLPERAWIIFDQSLIAAAALVAGALLAITRRARKAILLGALCGLAALAAVVLVRLAWGSWPAAWFEGRLLQGPAGYHNALGLTFAMGISLALWAAHQRQVRVRIVGGVSAGLLVSALMLTQSRGGILAAVVALAVQIGFTRSLRLAALATSAVLVAGLFVVELRAIDRALVSGATADQVRAQRLYGLWAVVAIIVLTALAASDPRHRLALRARRTVVSVAAGLLIAGVAVPLVVSGDVRSQLGDWTSQASGDTNPGSSPAGSTRLGSASLNGRRDMWRVAVGLAGDAPLHGSGVGTFARAWTQDRHLPYQNALHPHSLELEYLSELGIVGPGAFLAFVGLVVVGLARAPSRTDAAGALGVFVAVVVQSSVDWTWAFPGIVAPALFVVGAATGGASRRRLSGWLAAAAVGAALVALGSIAVPYFAERKLTEAERVQPSDPVRAWRLAADARNLNPWDPDGPSLQGLILERAREYRAAAARYSRAAELSQRPWAEQLAQARALSDGGDSAESRAVCDHAVSQNPLDGLLRRMCRDLSAGSPPRGGGERG